MDAICYAYDGATGEYAGTIQGDPSPLEPGVILYPARTTLLRPPTAPSGQRPVWSPSRAAWSLVADHRGETWFDPSGAAVIVGTLGDPTTFAPPLSTKGPTPATPTPTVTGNQWAFALGDLGLAAAWRAGIAKSKDKDQIRWSLIARDTPLLANDPLLVRIAVNAGNDANGLPLIDPPTVFAKALTESI